MTTAPAEKPALLVIDMVQGNLDESRELPITPFAKAVIPVINHLSDAFRQQGWPVVFPTDAFHEDDFFFTGRMRPHSLSGTPDAEIADDLVHLPGDYWMPKPSMSAFFKTGLENWLAERNVTLCAVAGIATPCASANEALHRKTLSIYRKNPLYPLFRVMSSDALLTDVAPG